MSEPTDGDYNRERATIIAHGAFHCTKREITTGEPKYKKWDRFAHELIMAKSEYVKCREGAMCAIIEMLIERADEKVKTEEMEQTLEWLKNR